MSSTTGSTRNRKPTFKCRNSSPSSTPTKKKKLTAVQGSSSVTVVETVQIEEVVVTTETSVASPAQAETADKIQVFKDPNFVHSTKGAAGSKRTRVWKNLKQLVAAEKLLPWKPDDVTYGSIEGPPSFKPAKKYSDISGLQACYRDPETKLRYSTAEEYSRLKLMPSDLVSGCLGLRKANAPVP